MGFRRHTEHAPILNHSLFDGMAHANAGTGTDRATRQVLVDAAHIDHAADRLIVVQGDLAFGGHKIHLLDRMVEVFWNAQGAHIADPTAAAGMDGVANLVLALQNQRARSLLRDSLSRRQPGRSATHDQNIASLWHIYPSLSSIQKRQSTRDCPNQVLSFAPA